MIVFKFRKWRVAFFCHVENTTEARCRVIGISMGRMR